MAIDMEHSIALDYPDTTDKHAAVLGMTGSGKTNTAYVFEEEIIRSGGIVTVVDPEGDYHRLKNEFNVLIIGSARRGNPIDLDVPPDSASNIAKVLVQRGVSTVLDMSGFTIRAKDAFLLAYVGALWEL